MDDRKPRKRAAGGGRKEAEHGPRLEQIARRILDTKCTASEAARLVAKQIITLGDSYNWGASVRVFSADTLARRLTEQWKRNGRGELLLAEERTRRLEQEKHSKQEERLAIQRYMAADSLSAAKAAIYQPDFVNVLGDLGAYRPDKSLSEVELAAIRFLQDATPLSVQSGTKSLSSREAEDLRKTLEGLLEEDE